jgi:trk system potassium uptake protein TrkA
MYIIIAGGGIVGSHITSSLANSHEITVIDMSDEVLENIHRQFDVRTLKGNAATPKTLREAEAERADLILAVTDVDEINMVTCFMAKEMGAKTTVARIRNVDYTGYFVTPSRSPQAPRRVIRPKNMGIDMVINPEAEAAKDIAATLSSLYSTPAESFFDGIVQIREFKIGDKALEGKRLDEISYPYPYVFAAIVREGHVFIPPESEALKLGDSVYVIAERDVMDELGKVFTHPMHPARSVVILGGGRIGFLLADALGKRGISVRLIEKDAERADDIAARLGRGTVLQGDGTDRDFLIAQGVPSSDAFIAVTDTDEVNILACLLVKNLGVDRTMAVLNKPEYVPLAEAIGITIAALPPIITAERIARFILRGAVSVALLEEEQLEGIELAVGHSASAVGKRADRLKLPGVVIGAILKGDKVILPPDDSVIEEGDHLVVVARADSIGSLDLFVK